MRTTIVAGLLLILAAAPAAAGGLGPMLTHWSTDEAGDDTGLGIKFELDLGPSWDLELRVSQYEELQFPESLPQFELEATPIDLGLAYNFSKEQRVNPYVGGGLTYVLFDIGILQNPSVIGRISDEAGFYAVAGVEFKVGRHLDLFAEAYLREVEAEISGDDLQSFVTLSLESTGPGVNVGLMLDW